MELYLGTGGFSNDDWQGLIYPEGTPSSRYLELYSRHFNAVELNSSFYAIPGERAFEGMLRKSGGKVRFAIKAHRSMTHDRDADEDLYQRLRLSVAPLREAGVLGPFLAQFPYSFHRTPANRRYLADLVARFEGEALAVELRNREWQLEEVQQSFREAGVTWVSVDYPQVAGMPVPELVADGGVAYLRLHGRNEEKWYGGSNASERHDYRYGADELRFWVNRIAEHQGALEQLYVFFLNTTRGHAIHDLRALARLLGEAGLEAPISL